MRFSSENAAEYGSRGGHNKYKHITKFREWVDETGWDKLIGWTKSAKFHEAFPATKFIFEMAYGKPKEQIAVENTTQVLIGMANDPVLNALAERFGVIAGRRREINTSVVDNGAPAIQTQSSSTSGV